MTLFNQFKGNEMIRRMKPVIILLLEEMKFESERFNKKKERKLHCALLIPYQYSILLYLGLKVIYSKEYIIILLKLQNYNLTEQTFN